MNLISIVTPPKTIAVVGLSDNPERPSYAVAKYLLEHGFTIIPVNPTIQQVLGLKTYASISAIPVDIHIDVVEIFRKSEFVPEVVQEVINTGKKPVIWMQEGVISLGAKKTAEDAGMTVIMDQCMMKTHNALVALPS